MHSTLVLLGTCKEKLRIMFTSKQKPIPQTTETCEMLLENVIEALKSTDSIHRAQANDYLLKLRERRCIKALLWIHQNFKGNPSPFLQQLSKKAEEYARSL